MIEAEKGNEMGWRNKERKTERLRKEVLEKLMKEQKK